MIENYDEMDIFAKFNAQEELDVDAFVRETTYVIWDLKMVGAIYACYTEETVINGADGSKVCGADQVVADTMAWLTAFPDLKIVIRDVIWSGNAVDGYRSSMPWSYTGTNTGVSKYGPATGKQLTMENNLGIANCLIQKVNGKWTYVDEYSTYDTQAAKRACTMDEE